MDKLFVSLRTMVKLYVTFIHISVVGINVQVARLSEQVNEVMKK